MYSCEECNLEFQTFQAKANHHRWQHLKYAYKNAEIKNNTSIKFSLANDRRFGSFIEEDVICSKELCTNIIHVKYRESKKKAKYFCSIKCRNAHIHSVESKEKCSKAVAKAWKDGKYDTDSFNEKQSTNRKFSSKIERSITKYFKDTYPAYGWKSGGQLIFQNVRISRDLYSDILKICFEYDGVWHFKDINGQLKEKRQKDTILENWCIENNYRLIRIDENDFKDFKQIEQLFFENTNPIIKIGNRY